MSAPRSLADIEAEKALWRQLWLVAVDEAYNAADTAGRMQEITGLDERAVVNVYFRYEPRIRDWAEAHVDAGTCAAATQELRLRFARMKDVRSRQRAEPVAWTRSNGDSWTAPFRAGKMVIPAVEAPVIEGEIAAPSRIAPTADGVQAVAGASDRTGAPGAPSSMHLVEAEMKRRAAAGEMLMMSLAAEAAALEDWCVRTHPTFRPVKANTVRNRLGALYRELKMSAHN